MSSGSQSPNPLLITIIYINPFYQKTQGKDTAQVFPSSSKQWEDEWLGGDGVAGSFQRGQKWCSGIHTPLPGTLLVVVTVQPNLFQDNNCSKNWQNSGMFVICY